MSISTEKLFVRNAEMTTDRVFLPVEQTQTAYQPFSKAERVMNLINQVLKLPKFNPGTAAGLFANILAALSVLTQSDAEVFVSQFTGRLPSYIGARDIQFGSMAIKEAAKLETGELDWKNGIGKNWDTDQKARFIYGAALLMEEKVDRKLADEEFLLGMHLLINMIDVVQVDGSMLSPEELEWWVVFKEQHPDIFQEVNYALHGATSGDIVRAIRMLKNGAYGQDVVAFLRRDGSNMAPPGGGGRGRTAVAGGEDEPSGEIETEASGETPELEMVTEGEPPDPRENLHTYKESINNRPQTGPLAGVVGAQELEQLMEDLNRLERSPNPDSPFVFLGSGAFKTVALYTDPVTDEKFVVIITDQVRTSELRHLEQLFRLGQSAEVLWDQSIFIQHPQIPTAGTAGIVLRYREGETLENVLRDPATTEHQRLEIARNMAREYAKMHLEAGVVSRDVKIDNMLINDTEVIPIDFGLMRPIGSNDVTFRMELSRLMTLTAIYLLPGSYTPLEAHRKFRQWYVAEAEKHLNVETTTGRTVESAKRRAILDQAIGYIDAAIERMENWN